MQRTLSSALLVLLTTPAALATEASLDDVLAAFRAGEYARVVETVANFPADAADYPRALYLLGETELLVGRPREAEVAFLGVLEARPEAVPALVGLGRAITFQGGYEDAEVHIQTALELEPEDLAAQRALGELYTVNGSVEDAIGVLRDVCAEAPNDGANVRALFQALLVAERRDAAADEAASFSAAHPEHPLGPFLEALALEQAGDVEGAISAYQRSIARDGRFLDAHKNLAILAHTQSDTYQIQARNELAMKHYERYFELGGGDAQLEVMFKRLKELWPTILQNVRGQ